MYKPLRLAILPMLLFYTTMFGNFCCDSDSDCSPTKNHEKIICQDDIPYVITCAGKYRLATDIVFNGIGSAITLNANNVTLNLADHSITLTNNTARGITVDSASEFVITSDAITNSSANTQQGIGLYIVNANKGLVSTIMTTNHAQGIIIDSSTDIMIQDCQFSHATMVGGFVFSSKNISFDTCVFADSGIGLLMSGTNQDCSLKNSDFPSSLFTNLLVQQVQGMTIEHCSFSNNGADATKANLVQFGDVDADAACYDVIMRECTIINRPSTPTIDNTAVEGLAIFQGSGFLIESCIIDIDNTDQDPDDDLSGVHISNPDIGSGIVATNVIIRNSIVQGPATNSFYPDSGTSGLIIENCLSTGAQKIGIFLAGTTASLVRNNTVTNNGTTGILLAEESSNNAVNNNVVCNNGFNPILTSIPPIATGIGIAADSTSNSIQHNDVFNNGSTGIDDQGTQNHIFYNTAYGNPDTDYNAATDIIVVSNPGNLAKTGENIAV